MVLNGVRVRTFLPFPEDIWPCLEALLAVTLWVGDTGIRWEECRDIAKHSVVHRTAFHKKELPSPLY